MTIYFRCQHCKKLYIDTDRVFCRYAGQVIQVDAKCYEKHYKWSKQVE